MGKFVWKKSEKSLRKVKMQYLGKLLKESPQEFLKENLVELPNESLEDFPRKFLKKFRTFDFIAFFMNSWKIF